MSRTRSRAAAFSPSAAFDRVLREARANETAALRQGKWYMGAYFRDMVDTLEALTRVGTDQARPAGSRDAVVLHQMRYLVLRTQAPLGTHDVLDHALAQRMALAVYARKVLRLAGQRVPHPKQQQRWLKGQRRYDDNGEPLARAHADQACA